MVSLGVLSDRLPVNDSLNSSANPIDSWQFTLTSRGGVNLTLDGLTADAILRVRSSDGTDVKPAIRVSSGTQALLPIDGLNPGTYTVQVELPPTSTSGTGSTGGTGSGGTDGTGSGGTPTPLLWRFSYSGSVTSLRDPSKPSPGLDRFSGEFDNAGIIPRFTFNGELLKSPNPSFGFVGPINTLAQGYSSDPTIGLVTLSVPGLSGFPPAGQITTSAYLSTSPSKPGDPPFTFSGDPPVSGTISENVVVISKGQVSASGGGTSNGGTGSAGSSTNSSSTNYRLILTPDLPGEVIGEAQAIPAIPSITLNSSQTEQTYSNPYRFTEYVGGVDSADYFSFTVDTPLNGNRNGTNVWLNIKDFAANVAVELLNSNFALVESINTATNQRSFAEILPAGTYYVRVASNPTTTEPNGLDTRYTLEFAKVSLSTELTYTTEPGQRYTTNLWQFNGGGIGPVERYGTVGIEPNKPTVLIIHGWNNTSRGTPQYVGDELSRLAQEIASKYSGYQVLGLDWGQAAYASRVLPFLAAGRVKTVADWALKNWLQPLGIQANNLTLIGHSFGSYVSAFIGTGIGKVSALYALDPAGPSTVARVPIASYSFDRANGNLSTFAPRYDAAANNSFAFFSNQYFPTDNGNQAATAGQSFVADTNGNFFDFGGNHGIGISALRLMISSNRISPNFTYIKNSAGGILIPTYNQYTNRGLRIPGRVPGSIPFFGEEHEGVISLRRTRGQWQIEELKYVNGGREVRDYSWVPLPA